MAVAISSGIFAIDYHTSTKLALQKTAYDFNNTSYFVTEFKLPDSAAPLFPLYDKNNNAIWVGDIKANSGRIWEFDIDSKKFIEHKIPGTNLISKISLGSDGTMWFIDPATKLLGHYNPYSNDTSLVKIPTDGILEGLVSYKKSVWILVPNIDEIMRYDIQSKNFTAFSVPTAHGSPIAITTDRSGYIWIVEAVGKILRLDPTSLKMIEYSPQDNVTLKLPISIKYDQAAGDFYISEHGEDAVFAFSPNNDTFKRFPLHPDPDALPFGMALDGRGNLFVAEHTINKIAVLDTSTGQSTEVNIPSSDPLTQWLTSDAKGNIWFAEPGGGALGVISERSQ
jgi:copper transport protein